MNVLKYGFKIALASALILSVNLPSQARLMDEEIDLELHQYSNQTNLSFEAQALYEKAKGLYHEEKFDQAHSILDNLLNAHPNHVPLHILLSYVYLSKHDTTQALQSFRTARLKAGTNADYQFKALLGEAQVYLKRGQTVEAINLLTEHSNIHLSKKQQEIVYFQLAQNYKRQKNWVKVYDFLQFAIRYGANHTPAREQLGQYREIMAKAKYYDGVDKYERGNYPFAVKAFRDANNLVPADPMYLEALEQSHEAFLQVVRYRWWPDLEWVKPRLNNISFYLNSGRYNQAYNLYLDLLKDNHIRLFIMNDLTSYLPNDIRKQLYDIEQTLIEQDYRLPRHRDPFWNTDLKEQKEY